MKEKNELFYNLYVNMLFYEFCPETMQTVSLVEKIYSDATYLYWVCAGSLRLRQESSSEDIKDLNCFAASCIERMLSVKIEDIRSTISSLWTFDTLTSLLKDKARSKQVKNYFGL